jgi:hypothetical protein
MSDAELAHYLDTSRLAKARLESRLTAVEELAVYRLKNGAVIENYATETTLTNSRWKPGLEAATLSAMTGKDLTKPGFVTPAEAKRRGVPDAVVAALTERVPTGTKLVRITAAKRAERLLKKSS